MINKSEDLIDPSWPVAGQPAVTVRPKPNLQDGSRTGAQKLLAAGGILSALGAASCCVVPFTLFMLGVSGAWIGNLTAIEPYKPIFVSVTVGFLGYGFYLVYRKPKVACAEGSYCAKPSSGRTAKIGLWTATVLVIVAIAFPKLAPLFL